VVWGATLKKRRKKEEGRKREEKGRKREGKDK
jgi:hypothetical protein